MCNYSKNFVVVILQPFSDFQIGGKYNNEKKMTTNKQFVCTLLLVLVIHPPMPQMTQMVIGKGVQGWMEMN